MPAASSRLVETPRGGHDWQAGLVRHCYTLTNGPAGLVYSSSHTLGTPCDTDRLLITRTWGPPSLFAGRLVSQLG